MRLYQIECSCNRKGIHVMKSDIRIIRLLKDKSRPCIANGDACTIYGSKGTVISFCAVPARQVRLRRFYRALLTNRPSVGVRDIKGVKRSGARVRLVKNNHIAKIKVTGKQGCGGGLKLAFQFRPL